MAGFFQVKELEARRRALAAESEVYRETLEQELRNLGSVALSARQRFARVRAFNPLFILGMPAAGYVFRKMFDRKKKVRKKSQMSRTISTLILGWKLYQKVAPVWQALVSQARKMRQRREENPWEWSRSYK
jgi:hypothetical protein